MPTKFVTAEEMERLIGSRGSVYFGTPPVSRSKPSEKTKAQEEQWRKKQEGGRR